MRRPITPTTERVAFSITSSVYADEGREAICFSFQRTSGPAPRERPMVQPPRVAWRAGRWRRWRQCHRDRLVIARVDRTPPTLAGSPGSRTLDDLFRGTRVASFDDARLFWRRDTKRLRTRTMFAAPWTDGQPARINSDARGNRAKARRAVDRVRQGPVGVFQALRCGDRLCAAASGHARTEDA